MCAANDDAGDMPVCFLSPPRLRHVPAPLSPRLNAVDAAPSARPPQPLTSAVQPQPWGSQVLPYAGPMPQRWLQASQWFVPLIHAALGVSHPKFDQAAARAEINAVQHNQNGNFNHVAGPSPGAHLAELYVEYLRKDFADRQITKHNWHWLFDVQADGYVIPRDQERLLFPVHHSETPGESGICNYDPHIFARIEVAVGLLVTARYNSAVAQQGARMAQAAALTAAAAAAVPPVPPQPQVRRTATTAPPQQLPPAPQARPTASSPPLPNDADANDADAHAPKATWVRPRSTTGNAFTCHTFTKYALLQVPRWLQFTTHCSLQHSTMYTTGNPE